MPDTHTFVVNARWIIPVIPEDACLEDHALVVSGETITDVLPQAQAAERYANAAVVDLPHHIVTPGLINAHGHAAMTLMRGYADDLELMDWLENHIWPTEGKFVDYDFVYDGTELAIAEMLHSGTTFAADLYFFPDAAAKAYTDHGFRAQLCLPVVQFSNAWAVSEHDHIHKALALHDHYKHSELIKTAFAPHAPYTVSDEAFSQIRTYSEELDMPVHLHLHETAFEVESAVADTGKRPFQRMADLGLISPNLQAVHMTQLLDEEIDALATNGVNVVHCPESNMKLASGFCRVRDLLDAGVNVCIGTDGAASNNNLDMIEEMRSAALLAKGVAGDPTAVDAHRALKMATLDGARMFGLEDRLGSLEAGKLADFIAVDVSDLAFQPMHHPVSQLVYTASGHQVSDVWINGEQLVKEYEYTRLDTDRLRQRINDWFGKMRK